jgi:chromosome segregation ATPase
MWITAEMMTDLYNHDAYSRQVAREAIERYNAHIERCNRAIEASDHNVPAVDSDNDRLTAELQAVTAERDSYRRERDLAKQELAEKERVLADMSLRLDALVKKADSGRNTPSALPVQGGDQKLVHHINTLQEQLYAERRENKRLKGA